MQGSWEGEAVEQSLRSGQTGPLRQLCDDHYHDDSSNENGDSDRDEDSVECELMMMLILLAMVLEIAITVMVGQLAAIGMKPTFTIAAMILK